MAEVYKVNIGLQVVGGAAVEAQLKGIQGALEGLSAGAGGVSKAFGLWNKLFDAEMIIGGIEKIGHALVEVITTADKFNEKLVALQNAGFSADKGRAAAYAIRQLAPTADLAGAVQTYGEVMPMTKGDQNEAITMAAGLEKVKSILRQRGISANDEGLLDLVRAVDIRGQMYTDGKFDASKFQTELSGALSMLVESGGLIKPSDVLQYTRMAGPAAQGQTAEAFYGGGMEIAASMGAAREGTALMSMYQQFVGGKMTQAVADKLVQLGIIGGYSKKGGGGIKLNEEQQTLENLPLLQSDPSAWIDKVLVPKLQAKGYNTPEAMREQLFNLAGRQTTMRYMSDVMSNQPQVERGRELFKQFQGVDKSYATNMDQSLTENTIAFKSAWDALITSLGGPMVKPAITFLQDLTTEANSLGAYAQGHQAEIKAFSDQVVQALDSIIKDTPAFVSSFNSMTQTVTAIVSGANAAANALNTLVATLNHIADAISGAIKNAIPNAVSGMLAPATNFLNQHGFDFGGAHPAAPTSVPPPPSADTHINVTAPLNVDGRKLAEGTASVMVKSGSAPPSGSATQDPSAVPYRPGLNYNAGL